MAAFVSDYHVTKKFLRNICYDGEVEEAAVLYLHIKRFKILFFECLNLVGCKYSERCNYNHILIPGCEGNVPS